MNQSVLETIIRLEQKLLDPKIRNNTYEVESLLDSTFFEIGASGKQWTRQEAIESLSKEQHKQFDAIDFKTLALADDLILVTYKTTTNGQLVVRTSFWNKKSNQWKMIFHLGLTA